MGFWRDVVEWLRARPLGLKLTSLAVLAFAVLGFLLVPVAARRAVSASCERRGLRCEVGAVRLGFGRIWLRDVSVDDLSLPKAHAVIDAVQVRPLWFMRAGIRIFGGRAELSATRDRLRERLRELTQSNKGEGSAGKSDGDARPLEVMGLDVRLRESAGQGEASLWGVRANRVDQGWFVALDLLQARQGPLDLRVRAAELWLGRDEQSGARRFDRVEVASAGLQVALPEASEPEVPTEPTAAGRRVDANTDKVRKRGRAAVEPVKAVVAPAPSPAPAPEPADSAAQLKWAALRLLLRDLTAPAFRGNVVALTVEARRGRESLRFGPSRFAASRAPDAFGFELVPLPVGGKAEATPLSMRARVPLEQAPPELDLTGGPVSLSALGVRDGDLGLVGVREARLETSLHAVLAPDLAGVDVSSQGLLENVRVKRAALGPNELSGIRLGWQFEGSFRGRELMLKQAEVTLGDVRLRLSGSVSRRPERTQVNLRSEVPQAACSALLAAVPHGMAPRLEEVRMEGTLALRASIDFDSAHLDATRVNLDVNNQCRISNVPLGISPNRFRDAWYREVKGADGSPMTIQSGPGSPDWTAYEEISPFLETAIVVCEDAGFFSHRGIDYRAIENSIRMNFEAGRFLRGGSTVTMQLAKNLYLGREKTLSRKFQEAVFTQLLEQELSKHELLELYLNVVEFGPGIYGVRQAARYYFNEEPRDLSLGQALYLASILPSPDTQHFGPDGRVRDGWAGYLRKLMHIARKIRRVTDEELNAGLAEQVAFRKPNASTAPLASDDDPPEGDADDAPKP
ncbi:MAG: biosynthetic peptidoglycan transglycosylase [Polyangiaceae bacterium]